MDSNVQLNCNNNPTLTGQIEDKGAGIHPF
jgi:hypothetical protein